MNNSVIQLLVLAGIAVFLILKLRSVLGTRDGFEKPPEQIQAEASRRGFEVIEGGVDRDIVDHVEADSAAATALAAMKKAERSFTVAEFLQGARGAYEMILMAFERGELEEVQPFLSEEVYESFAEVVATRDEQGLTVEAQFLGVREVVITRVDFDEISKLAEVSVRLRGEMTSQVRDRAGLVVEGSTKEVKKMRDVWTFSRTMGAANPNWQLTATGE